MWLFLLSVCLAIFHSSLVSSSEPHYVITLPNYLQAGTEQKICVTFQDVKGPVDIKIEVERNDERVIILQHRIDDYQHSECLPFQVPKLSRGPNTHVLYVSALGENLDVSENKNIAIHDREIPCIIHNDKSTYKPGDIVKFHVISIKNDLKASDKQFRSVEIIDSNKNRIAEWLNVTTKQGFAEFSFPLAGELAFGTYQINIANACEKEFKVDQYVPKRFEVNISAPSEIFMTDKSLHLDVCGRYTYGKPVEGLIDLSVCLEANYNVWNYQYYSEHESSEEDTSPTSQTNCYHLKGEKTDSKGCISRDIELGHFNFTTASFNNLLNIKSKLTESTTGHSEKASASVPGKQSQLIEFMDCKSYYVKNSTYHCKVKVRNEMGQPKVNEDITLYIHEEEADNVTHVNLVTDFNGIAEFTLKTSEWESYMLIKARLSSDAQDGGVEDFENSRYYFHEGLSRKMLWLLPYEPKIESLLRIQKHPTEIACDTDQTVTVEYDIHRKNLNADTDHLDFFYLIIDKTGIMSLNELEVNIKDLGNGQMLHGSFPINFHVENSFPITGLLVFSLLPNGETIARSTHFFVTQCIQNKVKLTLSEKQVRPGENVNLEITADAGALCSVRSVDKGYLLDKPHDDSFWLRIGEHVKKMFCSPFRLHVTNDDREMDLLETFQEHSLLVFTNTGSKVARMSASKKKDADKEIPKGLTRNYFPDTWLFELVAVGSDGHVVLNRSTPHSITSWSTDVFCLGKDGLDGVSDVALTTFQPYFIDLIVPFSVVQGEKCTIQALVFNYAKKCILIVVALSDSEDLITAQDKEQARCVCEGHSHSFTWDVSAIKLKKLKILVDSGSIDVEGDCKEDALLVGKDLRTDSVEKTIQVKPKGYEDEKTKTFLLFPADNREPITFAINAPERMVEGSERAHVIIMGDLMANVLLNLDYLVNLPDGCGEQNLAKFARYVSTWEYLESTGELTPEIKAEAKETMTKGYQKQLTHKIENGSYSMFHSDPNIWLNAFVLQAFNGAKKIIHIDEKDIQESVNWLQSKQLPYGCFEVIGHYFNNIQEADDEVTCTAYVTIALLEHQMIYNGSIVENALSCLRKSLDSVTSVYTRALLAYAFTLSGDSELRHQTLEKLKQSIVKEDDYGAVETAAYVVLSLLSDKETTMKNLEDSGDIIRWMVKKQNPWGGFGSSQDTTIALQAVAKYGKAIYRKKGDSTVTIRSKSGFEKSVHVDKRNSLFVQTVDLPEIPGEYSISATGEGFLYIQSHLHCNVLPEQNEKGYFSLHINTEPCDWNHASKKEFHVHLDVGYLGKRKNTNMALIIVRMVSGYVPNRESVEKLKKNPLVERTEISAQNLTIYLQKLTHEITKLHFSVEQEAQVDNLQPATAAAIDYYDPEEYTVVEYTAPWDSVVAHCAISATEREDCGHKAITKEQCEQKGCCYDSSIHETKWCFHHGFKKIESSNQKQ